MVVALLSAFYERQSDVAVTRPKRTTKYAVKRRAARLLDVYERVHQRSLLAFRYNELFMLKVSAVGSLKTREVSMKKRGILHGAAKATILDKLHTK